MRIWVVVDVTSLEANDEIEIHVAGATTFDIKKKREAKMLLAKSKNSRCRLPAEFKFRRLNVNNRS